MIVPNIWKNWKNQNHVPNHQPDIKNQARSVREGGSDQREHDDRDIKHEENHKAVAHLR